MSGFARSPKVLFNVAQSEVEDRLFDLNKGWKLTKTTVRSVFYRFSKISNCANKKVLLRERKRHTARRVASACYAGEGGFSIQSWWGGGGGTPSSHGGGYPIQVMVGGTPSSHGGGTPSTPHHPDLAGGRGGPSYYVRGR